MIRTLAIVTAAVLVSSCAGPQVTHVQKLSETADAPYQNILVVSLFELFDTRRYLEQAIVKDLEAKGIRAVASTAHMNTKTPLTRETFLNMVEEQGSDAVLVTQLINLESTAKERDARPESTYIVRPTYYFNVWNVNLTEFVEPTFVTYTHDFGLATQVYSASAQDAVWGIETKTKLKTQRETQGDWSFIDDEASAIVRALSVDGLLP